MTKTTIKRTPSLSLSNKHAPCALLHGILILVCAVAAADVRHIPGDFDSIAAASAAAQPGDTLLIAPGTYKETVTLADGLTLAGEDAERCVIQGKGAGILLSVSGQTEIRNITIKKGDTGIMVRAGASLTLDHCRIIENKTDGIGFEKDFNTHLLVKDCLVARNGDGIDLESTQAVLWNTTFVDNGDDGLDLDGDAAALVYGCTFDRNGDDGIEIRIATRTHAIIQSSQFHANGEDGIEVINSPIKNGIRNLLCVQNCNFDANKRYAVGFVVHDDEKATAAMSKTAVYAAVNTFVGTAVSPNYAPVFDAHKDYPESARVTLEQDDKVSTQDIQVRMPVLVGIYDLRPTADGTRVDDAEGVTVYEDSVLVADDNTKRVYFLDKSTGNVVRSIPTAPLPASAFNAPGPEGLDVVAAGGEHSVLLADDDGRSVYTLSLGDDTFGNVLRRQDTTAVGPVEGVELVGNRLILAANRNKLYQVARDTFAPVAPPIEITVEDFGDHVAGVGASDSDSRLFVTVSGYAGAKQTWRNHRSVFLELDDEMREVSGLWHLGPFSNDPRGVAVSDGLVYIADGRSPFTDKDTGEVNLGGIKVLVFLKEDDPDTLWSKLPLLPLRHSVQ